MQLLGCFVISITLHSEITYFSALAKLELDGAWSWKHFLSPNLPSMPASLKVFFFHLSSCWLLVFIPLGSKRCLLRYTYKSYLCEYMPLPPNASRAPLISKGYWYQRHKEQKSDRNLHLSLWEATASTWPSQILEKGGLQRGNGA